MKLKKAHIHALVLIILAIISLMVALIFSNILIFFYVIVILCYLDLLFILIERKVYKKKILPLFTKKEYDKASSILNNKIGNMWTFKNNRMVLIDLALLYMLNDQAVYTKKIILENPKLKKIKSLYYIQFLIGFAEGDKGKVLGLYKKIMDIKHPRFKMIKNSVKSIVEMANTKKINKELCETTAYPLLKRICLKYEDLSIILDDLNTANISYTTISNKPSIIVCHKSKLFVNVISCAVFAICSIGSFIAFLIEGRFIGIEIGYYLFEKFKICLFLLPISIFHLIYIIYLRKSGFKSTVSLILSICIVIGMVTLGSLFFVTKLLYTTNNKTFENITVNMDRLPGTVVTTIDRPDEYEIIGNSFCTAHPSYLEDKAFLVVSSVIRITDEDYDEVSEKRYWKTKLHGEEYLPSKIVGETIGYDYYFVYPLSLSPVIFDNGEYLEDHFYVFAYDMDKDVMLMYELYVVELDEIDAYKAMITKNIKLKDKKQNDKKPKNSWDRYYTIIKSFNYKKEK